MVERKQPGSGDEDPSKKRVDKSLSTRSSAAQNQGTMSSDAMAAFLLKAYTKRVLESTPTKKAFLENLEDEKAKREFRARWKSQHDSAMRIAQNFPKPTEAGKALEALLGIEIETAKLFGDYTSLTPAVFSDDVHNKVDGIIEWIDDDSEDAPLRLAVDYSTSGLDARIQEKIKVKQVDGTKVEFLFSEADVDNPVQRVIGLPRIVIGIDAKLLGEAGRAASQNKKMISEKVEKDGGVVYENRPNISRKAYKDHPLQLMLLDQAAIQMDLHVREEAARISKRLTARHRTKPLEGIDLLELRSAIESAMNEKLKDMKVDELVDVVDGILQGHPNQVGEILADHTIAKWKNWSGVRRKVIEKQKEVLKKLKKIAPPDLKQVREWERKSNLHGALHEFVSAAA